MEGTGFKIGIFAIALTLLGPPALVQGQGGCVITNIPVKSNFREDKVCIRHKNRGYLRLLLQMKIVPRLQRIIGNN